jgi:hypothetical protein
MARAKATTEEPILSEEELAALTQEQAPVEETPVVEEAPTRWEGHPTRAYRSFAVPYGGVVAESINTPNEVLINPSVDGQQEEPQV